jgi:hypothetical protein
MRCRFANKHLAIWWRCSIYASCSSAAAMVFIWLNPRQLFGLSDDEFLLVDGAAYQAANFARLGTAD